MNPKWTKWSDRDVLATSYSASMPPHRVVALGEHNGRWDLVYCSKTLRFSRLEAHDAAIRTAKIAGIAYIPGARVGHLITEEQRDMLSSVLPRHEIAETFRKSPSSLCMGGYRYGKPSQAGSSCVLCPLQLQPGQFFKTNYKGEVAHEKCITRFLTEEKPMTTAAILPAPKRPTSEAIYSLHKAAELLGLNYFKWRRQILKGQATEGVIIDSGKIKGVKKAVVDAMVHSKQDLSRDNDVAHTIVPGRTPLASTSAMDFTPPPATKTYVNTKNLKPQLEQFIQLAQNLLAAITE